MGTKPQENVIVQLRDDVAELYELSSDTNKTVDTTKCLARDVDLRVRRLQRTNGKQFGLILATQRQHGKRFDRVEAQLDTVEQRLDGVDERLYDLTAVVDQMSVEMHRMSADVESLTTTVEKLSTTMDKVVTTMDQVITIVGQVITTVDQLTSGLGALTEMLVERGLPPQDAT